jgi:NAD(P)-dependent dehydrogenase (short-subunit alcohol dehydrogenase family)
MNFNDLNLDEAYTPMKAYCQSKLANVLFCKELARRLGGKGSICCSKRSGRAVDRLAYCMFS